MIERSESVSNEPDINRFNTIYKSALAGGLAGGTAYGISKWAGSQEVAERLSVGLGAGIGFAAGGLVLGVKSSYEAERYAREGKKLKAHFKIAQAALESSAGAGIGGAIAGYEVKGFIGAMWGGLIGAAVGVGSITSNKEMVDRAYFEGPLYQDEDFSEATQ